MRKTLLLIFTALSLLTCNAQEQGSADIIPMPNKLEVTAGRVLRLGSEVKISIPKDLTKRKAIVGYLEGRLSDNNIHTTATTAKKAQLLLVVDNTLQDEAYELTVTPKRAVIKSNSQGAGFFYGVQSFMQLVPADADADAAVQCVEIKDAPRFQYRGAMIDVARNFQSKQTVLRFIDLMAAFKMNRLHIHLTDDQGWRIEIKRYPLLTEVGSKRSQTMIGHSDYYYPRRFDGKPQEGFYTQQDIKEMVAYAADRFITIIPEIEMPGHSSAALAAYPQYSCGLGKQYVVRDYMDIFDEVYCPQEQTFEFLQNVLTEVMDLFPSEYIHIGGDECPKKAWKVCPRCQTLIKKLNLKDEHELQSWFVHRIERFVNSKGKSIIGWDEILEGGLAPNATVMSWRGEVGGIEAAKMKHKVIMTPGDYCYIDHYQEDPEHAPLAIGSYLPLDSVYAYNPLPESLTPEEQKYIIGTQANLWGEYVQTADYLEYMAYPRLMAMAEVQWTDAEKKDVNNFHKRLKTQFAWLDKKGVHACRNFYEAEFGGTWNNAQNVYEVKLKTLCPDAEIRYALDCADESRFKTYSAPIALDKETELWAAVYVDGKRMGGITHKRFAVNKATGCEYTCSPKAAWENMHEGYALTDGLRGFSKDTRYWTGFNKDTLRIDISLHEATTISRVKLGTLWRTWNSMWPAREVRVMVSDDGNEYRTVACKKPEYDFSLTEATRFPVEVKFEESGARFVRLVVLGGGKCHEGHYNAGEPSELALDEIEIY